MDKQDAGFLRLPVLPEGSTGDAFLGKKNGTDRTGCRCRRRVLTSNVRRTVVSELIGCAT